MSTVYSFEEPDFNGFRTVNSTIEISREHFKNGQSSLKWIMNGQSSLEIAAPIGYQPFIPGSLDQARHTFAFWVYAPCAHKEALRFTFLKEGKPCVSFSFSLNFTGWRTAWVPFDDMEGVPSEGMDTLVISSHIPEPAVLYLDQMILSVPIDPRHPTRDCQVPFVNLRADTAANSHWLSLYRFSCLKKDALTNAPGKEPDPSLPVIANRLEEYYMSHCQYPEGQTEDYYLELSAEIQNDYEKLADKTVDAACHKACYPSDQKERLTQLANSIDIKEYGLWMLRAAHAWHCLKPENRQALEQLFIKAVRHLLDQGWADGSSLGTTHHLGYPMRSYYQALFLMRNPLSRAGLSKDAAAAMMWYSGCGRIFRPTEEIKGESTDTLNTLLQGILASILMHPNPRETNACLGALSRWLSACMLPAPGLSGPYKADGSAFHHCSHYPAYAMGGFTGAAPVLWALSRTPYAISEPAHKTMRHALLTMRLYCNHFHWLVSMSSRHPKGTGEMSGISTLEPFYYMAMAGSPDGREEIDGEMAAALLRLEEYMEYPPAKKLALAGYQKEENPEGHFTLNYACASLHRRDHWLAGVRGHSRYIWGNETYVQNNLYGRYITYGNLQILGSGAPVNNKDSGFYQEGWDWNSWPGTTAVYLPLESLRADVRNVDTLSGFEEMLLSDEAFAGGTHMNKENGIYAMKLHSHGKYDATQRARKSWFFFSNRILCLGTGIENQNRNGETRTTLFQSYLSGADKANLANSPCPITGLNTETSYSAAQEPIWFTDPSGNGYYIPQGQACPIRFTRTLQKSRSQDKDQPTEAPFAKAWIDHGTAPQNSSYEYLILVSQDPHQTGRAMERFTAQAKEQGLPYSVIQADNQAHIVYDKETCTTAYVLFEPGSQCTAGAVLSAEAPCLIMEKPQAHSLLLSICDPDLRLYEGTEADQLDENGIQREVSLYSRTWRKHPSIGKDLTITLKGKWNLADPKDEITISHTGDQTRVTVFCHDANTYELILIPEESN